jgi:hypothetical protein
MKALAFLAGREFTTFAIGAAAGLVLPPVLKSKTVRKLVVSVAAKGMSLRDVLQ